MKLGPWSWILESGFWDSSTKLVISHKSPSQKQEEPGCNMALFRRCPHVESRHSRTCITGVSAATREEIRPFSQQLPTSLP